MHKLMIMLMLAPEGGEGGGGGTPSPAPSPAPAPQDVAPPAPENKKTPGAQPATPNPESVKDSAVPKATDPRNDDPAKPELPKYFSQFDSTKRETDEYKEMAGKHKTLTELADAYIDTSKRLSRSLELPGKDATHEEMQAFLAKLGVPENVDGYELQDNGLEGDEMAAEFKKHMAEQFMRNGMTKKQANGMWNTISQLYKEGNAYVKAEQANRAATFDDRMSSHLEDVYQVKAERENAMKEAATLFRQHIQRTGLGKAYKDSGLIYDPAFVLAIAKDEKSRSGNTLIPGRSNNSKEEAVGAFGGKSGYSKEFMNEIKR
ncbi:MAG: hypothetical protein PHR69_09470 [Sphaerochaeta sp.]|nr:hypothetical protein [Sphaerochaeta sp.]